MLYARSPPPPTFTEHLNTFAPGMTRLAAHPWPSISANVKLFDEINCPTEKERVDDVRERQLPPPPCLQVHLLLKLCVCHNSLIGVWASAAANWRPSLSSIRRARLLEHNSIPGKRTPTLGLEGKQLLSVLFWLESFPVSDRSEQPCWN